MLSVMLPIETISEMNWRGHPKARWRRLKAHKMAAGLALGGVNTARIHDLLAEVLVTGQRLSVTLTRYSAGRLDSDNLASSQKGVRDGVAAALGIDDGSEIIEWRYAQEKTKRGVHAVRVDICIKCTPDATGLSSHEGVAG
jgi:hypothetical protein